MPENSLKKKGMLNNKRTRKLGWILGLTAVLMFGFGFLLVPLYNVVCKSLGVNGKTANYAAQLSRSIDMTRMVKVQFLANVNRQLPWDFYPQPRHVLVHPGERKQVAFYVRNRTSHAMTVQAIPSVTPGLAAQSFKKIACFCFTRQTVAGNTTKRMPLLFYIDTKLPKNINSLALSYTLFDVTPQKKQ